MNEQSSNFNILQVNVTDSSFLSILDMVALNLRLNRTVTSKANTIRMYVIAGYDYNNLLYIIIGARVREVFPGSGRVLGIQVGNNYITLPGEIFEDITESGNGAHDSHAGSSSQNIYNL